MYERCMYRILEKGMEEKMGPRPGVHGRFREYILNRGKSKK